jgi:hypothetical protein
MLKVASEGFNQKQGGCGDVGLLEGRSIVALLGNATSFIDGHISSFHCR